ncbi:PREDICTED: ribonucleases P/MRP protein subunit POP1 [Vollenhovia emeryi]|uniref:ribonucleases P/MRP protein subunit POP1 n=1 Tax=Vollenhovia emeryi TaxID=411798 RepID=UPI0005F4CB70|nr:PREDICTED: ribonucleases P/MRP protein subunit POP1 [Vollenhovia emeryi]
MKRKQFDEFLGGNQTLPHEVSIMNFVSSRAHEISAMTSLIEHPKQNRLIFQKLPVYMRRRVMSHNVKRVPRRLREAHLAQMKKSEDTKNLKPSRKCRRRTRNLHSEFNRRQCNKVWLETHIWHAKRFHMIDKWGYRIASHPNDKCFRANYRAAAKYCLLQDISYYTCVEITGRESLLKTTLRAHCNPSTLTFAAKRYISGHREGTLMFFKKDGYPRFPIGNVSFIWQPIKSDNQTDVKTIWIWVHPAFYEDFLSEIMSSFEFKRNNAEQDAANAIHSPNHLYTNDAGCKMIVLRNVLNRFRLSGPLTLNVLMKALRLPALNKLDLCPGNTVLKENNSSSSSEMIDTRKVSLDNNVVQPTEKMVIDEMSEENTSISKHLSTKLNKNTWYIDYYTKEENMEAFKVQEKLWQVLKSSGSPNHLPANMIVGATVLDPRFCLPEKRTKCNTEVTETSRLSPIDWPITCSNYSSIWDAEIRDIVSSSCMSTSIINKIRGGCLVPGVSNDQHFNEDIIAKIPILLIQKPGTMTGFGSGIDIIVPARWAMPFWLAFLMQCARVGALRESKSIAFESLNLDTPEINEPDSPAYTREALITKEELTKKYFRYPPNRRVNFVKLRISSPFFCDWVNLTKEWSGNEVFYVLRNRELLLLLQAGICPAKNRNIKLLTQSTQSDIPNLDDYKNCLVRVQISMIRKGAPKKFAIICMPTLEDLKKFENNKKCLGPIEKCHNDPKEKTRKTLRKNHLILLKRLRRQRVRWNQELKNNTLKLLYCTKSKQLNEEHASVSSRQKIISDHSVKMSELYLPNCTGVRYSCDREVMGYIILGDFSFSQAKGIGIGYVALPSLLRMIDEKSNIVLVRNIQTRQYRLAKLNILGV